MCNNLPKIILLEISGMDTIIELIAEFRNRKKNDFVKKQVYYRAVCYIVGLLILAMGLTLNTKAGLGVSPIISVSYSTSEIFQLNFGNTTLILYCIFVVVELILHSVQKNTDPQQNRKLILLMDILQIPLSLIFTRFLNLFGSFLPDFSSGADSWDQHFPLRLLVLILAIICTGIGAAMSLSMRIVPNPGDGIVQAIADGIHKDVGFTKNCFDLLNITITITLGLLLAGHLVGVGIGTVLAVIGVGRVIALFQHFAGKKLTALAGV